MTDEKVNGQSPMQKDCVCLQLHVRMPGVRAKADKSKLDLGGADQDMISMSKKIVDSAEYRKVRHCVSEMRAFLRTQSLPAPTLRGGFHMIPLPLIEKVEEKLDGLRNDFFAYVDAFIAAYENGLIDDARKRLGDLFDEDDYPTAAKLRGGFDVQTVYISLDVPGRLRTVSQALFEKERERASKRWKALEEEATAVLRAEMKSLVDKMVEQLGTTENGRKKSFRQSNVDKLTTFMENMEFRNVNDDAELAKLVNSATRLLNGVDVDSVKKDDTYRNAVRDSFNLVKTQLDTLVIDKPTRAVTFDEEV